MIIIILCEYDSIVPTSEQSNNIKIQKTSKHALWK